MDLSQSEIGKTETEIYLSSALNVTTETICSLIWSLDLDTQQEIFFSDKEKEIYSKLDFLDHSFLGGELRWKWIVFKKLI